MPLSSTISNIPKPPRGTNGALMSICGVIGGTYLMFRALSPNKDGTLISEEEREMLRGGSNGSPFGTRTARPPRGTAH